MAKPPLHPSGRSRLRHAPWSAIALGLLGFAFLMGYHALAMFGGARAVEKASWMIIVGAVLWCGGYIRWNDALGERISRLERLLATREGQDAGADEVVSQDA